jgi:hypothetical protein
VAQEGNQAQNVAQNVAARSPRSAHILLAEVRHGMAQPARVPTEQHEIAIRPEVVVWGLDARPRVELSPEGQPVTPSIVYLLGIIFMGVAVIKFKGGDMEAMGKNLGGSVMLFLVPKIVETIITWAAK